MRNAIDVSGRLFRRQLHAKALAELCRCLVDLLAGGDCVEVKLVTLGIAAGLETTENILAYVHAERPRVAAVVNRTAAAELVLISFPVGVYGVPLQEFQHLSNCGPTT